MTTESYLWIALVVTYVISGVMCLSFLWETQDIGNRKEAVVSVIISILWLPVLIIYTPLYLYSTWTERK